MKHAGQAALKQVETLLQYLRESTRLVERSPGSFYLKSSAYLHFHEDPAGMFVDVKLDGRSFERFRVSTRDEQANFLSLLAAKLAVSAR